MTQKPTWQECADAGMSQREAAEAIGVTKQAASQAAKRLGLTFRQAWSDPERLARQSAAQKETWVDPDVRARRIAAMKEARSRPERNPLVLLTETELADYSTLKRAGYSRGAALRAIGREDLIRGGRP